MYLKRDVLVACLMSLLLVACKQPLERVPLEHPAFDATTLAQLRTTQVINLDDVLADKQLLLSDGEGVAFTTTNPYSPSMPMTAEACALDVNCNYAQSRFWMPEPRFPAQSMVYDWWSGRATDPAEAAVCGVRFSDDSLTDYTLETFANVAALEASPGAVLTHFQACGTCSSLADLAIYGELDLTKMAKTCSKRLSLAEKKTCMQAIGFSEACAESWAYNATKTGQSCALICVAEYGLVPLLTGTENKPPVNADGELNACLMCDEMMAGPGFQYAAGRTRRNSGIISEIDRPQDQVYEVPHAYFNTP